MEIEIPDIKGLNAAARQFLDATQGKRHFAFYGAMGAGKTTFIKAICEQLGTTDIVSSPTFAIINEYNATNGRIFHFDFYRIKNLDEAYNLGYEDYFFGDDYCFVEWPEKIEDILPEHFTTVRITAVDDNRRTIEF